MARGEDGDVQKKQTTELILEVWEMESESCPYFVWYGVLMNWW